MKAVKILGVVLALYVAGVFTFESLLGIVQPEADTTFVITTYESDGTPHERVVSRLESGGQLYVAANHWPRAWFARAQENPDVTILHEGATREYRAVSVGGAEHDRVNADNALGFGFRLMTGFPPRAFLRLDPKPVDATG